MGINTQITGIGIKAHSALFLLDLLIVSIVIILNLMPSSYARY